MKNRVELSLYVSGMNTNSNTVYTQLTKHCDEQFGVNYSLTLYDLKKDPAAAEMADILTTPTIIRDFPFPQIRVTGNLTNTHKVMAELKLLPGE